MKKELSKEASKEPTEQKWRINKLVQSKKMKKKQKNVYMDNHQGISARQRDSKVSMTDLVSAEDDVNLRV